MSALAVGYVLLGLLIVLVEVGRKRTVPYDALLFFNVVFLVCYVLAPIAVLAGGQDFTRSARTYARFGPGGIQELVSISAAYLMVFAGYSLMPLVRSPLEQIHFKRQVWPLAFCTLVIIGLSALAIYVQGMGGLRTAVTEGVLVRARRSALGISDVNTDLLFLKHLIAVLGAAMLLVIAVSYDKLGSVRSLKAAGRGRLVALVLLALAVIFVNAFILASRRGLLVPLLILFCLFGNLHRKWHAKTGFLVFGGGILCILLWNTLLQATAGVDVGEDAWSEKFASAYDTFAVTMAPLTDSYMQAVGLLNQEPVYWLFRDFAFAPLYLVPSHFLPFDLPSFVNVSTNLLRGSDASEVAGSPGGFIGYLYMSGGPIGILIGAFGYGVCLKFLHSIFLPRRLSAKRMIVYIWIVFATAYYARESELQFIVSGGLSQWWIALLVISAWALIFGIEKQKKTARRLARDL